MTYFVVDTEQNSLKQIEKCLMTVYPQSTVILHSNPGTVMQEVERYKPNYYISDINLNGIDGIALAEKIKQDNALIQIAIMSNCREYAVQAYRIHADSYLIKPITEEKIRKYLAVKG